MASAVSANLRIRPNMSYPLTTARAPLTEDGAVLLASAMMVQALVKQIPSLTESIEHYDEQRL